MNTAKRWIVIGLEAACGALDRMPGVWYNKDDGWHVYRNSCYGCYPLHLAHLSDKLDQRWGTEVWK